ncbi:MAG TPA: GNAT family N-acetyltransferase [Candidatus Limnocylindria bacterium]|nr:GNAT family N-acetyltransferase [Candidatus Limnocylindria bacterium]
MAAAKSPSATGRPRPEVKVVAVTPDHWPDVVDLFTRKGPRGGTPMTDGCWCQFWLLRGKEASDKWGAPGRRRLRAEVGRGTEPGLLAYVDGVPVGWCRIGPREMFDRLEHSATLRRVDDEPVWSVVCFYVHPRAKRMGVASALLKGAEEAAARHGARLVEAYPVGPKQINLDAYTGYAPMYEAAGYDIVRRAGRRTVVRKQVAP